MAANENVLAKLLQREPDLWQNPQHGFKVLRTAENIDKLVIS
jgi:hypothetical protein